MEQTKLPKDWKWVKLGEAMQVLDNLRKPINSSERQQRIAGKSKKELFPYYGATGQVGWIDGFLTDGEFVLVGEDGAPFLDIFKEKAYKIKGKTWVNNHAHILKELSRVTINDFILHYLNSINYRHYVNGTTRLKLTKGSLVEIPFPLPSINTQLAIVSKIEELFSEIENGIKSLFTAQQQLKTYRQSVLKWAFEGKLTNSLNYDLCDLRDEHDLNIAAEPETEYVVERDHNNHKNQKNHSSDKGELLEGWKWVKLQDVISKLDQGWSPKCENESSKNINEWAVIKTSAVQHGYFLSNENKKLPKELKPREQHELKAGDILITRAGPRVRVGVCCMIKHTRPKLINCDKVYRISVNNNLIIPEYIELILNSPIYQDEIEKMKSGINDSGLNLTQKTFLQIKIPLPAILEQQQIVDSIESRFSVADKMEESINQSLQQSEALKQSVLKRAFEGRLISN